MKYKNFKYTTKISGAAKKKKMKIFQDKIFSTKFGMELFRNTSALATNFTMKLFRALKKG